MKCLGIYFSQLIGSTSICVDCIRGIFLQHTSLFNRFLVDRVAPGVRVAVLAVSSLFNAGNRSVPGMAAASIRTPYLKVVGITVEACGGGRTRSSMTSAEEEQMLRLARDPQIYEKLEQSIAPQISGSYTKDLKKAIACLLMGGSRKILPDGVRLRGDINVLLMGGKELYFISKLQC